MADDFLPAASADILRLRATLLRRVRAFFDSRDFVEVETPTLSADTVVDRHLDPFRLADQPPERPRWLQTSAEFGMKRLLAAGMEAIYQISRVFRRDEVGPWHNPEFTMLEWYRAGDDMHDGIELLDTLNQTLLERPPAERVTYADVFEQHVGRNPHRADGEQLVEASNRLEIIVPESLALDDHDGWLDLLWCECVQPRLGHARPTIVHDYPASQAALARIRPDDPPVAERFELFVDGIELANGYHELTDPAELTRRAVEANRLRQHDGKPPLPVTSRLLATMQTGRLPPSAGVALGIDRLIALAAGLRDIRHVLAFPHDRA